MDGGASITNPVCILRQVMPRDTPHHLSAAKNLVAVMTGIKDIQV